MRTRAMRFAFHSIGFESFHSILYVSLCTRLHYSLGGPEVLSEMSGISWLGRLNRRAPSGNQKSPTERLFTFRCFAGQAAIMVSLSLGSRSMVEA